MSSSSARADASEVKRMKKAIKANNDNNKEIRKLLLGPMDRLYEYMRNKNLTEYEGVKIKEIKPRAKGMKQSEKKALSVRYFEETLDLPTDEAEKIYTEYLETLKHARQQPAEEEEEDSDDESS